MSDQVREAVLDTARRGPTVSSYLRHRLGVVVSTFLVLGAAIFVLDGWPQILSAAVAGFGLGILVEGYWRACSEALAVRAIAVAREAMGRFQGEGP